jgi:hypothetical protein
MKLTAHTRNDYAEAQRALLPPGAAFEWPQDGFGDSLLKGMADELVRVGEDAQKVLDNAIALHTPKYVNWHIDEYRRVALAAIAGVAETLPRKKARIGSKVGDRLWSAAVPAFPVDLLRIDHLVGPLRVGSHVGDRAWTPNGRFVLRVRYYSSVVNPRPLWDALLAFKQAHVYLWFEDITGTGGSYGQN